MSRDAVKAPDVLMLLGTTCPHCQGVLLVLTDFIKRGIIGSLQVVNLEQRPALAETLGVRGVPWVRIGWFELEGLHSKAELLHWVEQASSPGGAAAYLSDLLGQGQVKKVLAMISRHGEIMDYVIALMDDTEASINVRLGIGVIMEEFAAKDWFQPYIEQLVQYCRHADARVRSDACHYLALTGNREVVAVLQGMLADESEDVVEVAQDGLDTLASADA